MFCLDRVHSCNVVAWTKDVECGGRVRNEAGGSQSLAVPIMLYPLRGNYNREG